MQDKGYEINLGEKRWQGKKTLFLIQHKKHWINLHRCMTWFGP